MSKSIILKSIAVFAAAILFLVTGCNDDNISEPEDSTGDAPEIIITSPGAWQQYDTTQIPLSIMVTNNATINNIVLFIDGDSVTTLNNQPYQYAYQADSRGLHTFIAKAVNNSGSGLSQLITFSITQEEGGDTTQIPQPQPLVTRPALWQELKGKDVTFSVAVTHPEYLQGIVMYIDDDSTAFLQTKPYEFTHTFDYEGSHTFLAEAVDIYGNRSLSQLVTFTILAESDSSGTAEVNPEPLILSPALWQEFNSMTIPLKFTVLNPGQLDYLTVYINGDSAAVLRNAPYEMDFNAPYRGNHSLLLKAVDLEGEANYSSLVSFTILDEGGAGEPPVPAILSPAAWQEFSSMTVPMKFAVMNSAQLDYLTILIDGDSTAAFTASPFEMDYNFSQTGTHTVMAKAVDKSGEPYYSKLVTVTVIGMDIKNPTAVITFPAQYAAISGPNMTVRTEATDDRGIERVELLIDGVLAATLTAPPYEFTIDITGYAAGQHTLLAKAYDDAGNTGLSQVVYVTF